MFVTTNGSTANNTVYVSVAKSAVNVSALDVLMASVYLYTTAFMSVLSIAGSIILVVTYAALPSLRTTGRRLLVYLSIADFLTALGNLLGITWYIAYRLRENENEAASQFYCHFHSALTIFSSISSFLWTMAIGVHLYLCIVRSTPKTAEKMFAGFHVTSWGVPGIRN